MSQDKARRKQLREAHKAAERDRRIALCPLTEQELADLVADLEAAVELHGCDHSTRFAEVWAAAHGRDWADLDEGLAELGGYCDCEISVNCDPDTVFGR
ncbi:DUF2695 domain-containing protein [Crossiella cryophila]|uniref:DUF2695 domain-containing protein n=1 Tax=Crossiella cryophila TaxID=43355 RepID=A0A7W7FS82_9PSEU|nr:DUF2695 domain-containing protein [Crossiella cryophila]MBB4675877.1 hypothetical protein [Crossiella cryophila]